MTITITPSAPTSQIGLGMGLTLQSTFIGPLPTGTRWSVGVYVGSSSPANLVWGETFATLSVGPTQYILGLVSSGLIQTPQQWPADGASVLVEVFLSSTSTLDTGTATLTWSRTGGLWYLAYSHFNSLSFAVPSAANVNAILAAVRRTYVNSP